MRARVGVLFAALFAGCQGEAQPCGDAPPSLTVRLEGALAGAKSIEVQLAYGDVSRKYPYNVEGAMSELVFGLVPPPAKGARLVATAWGYERPDARGAQILWGEAESTVEPNGCNELAIPIAETGEGTPDGGVGDAGATMAMCTSRATSETALLYTFESIPNLRDVEGQSQARWYGFTASSAARQTQGPSTCGAALGFEGDGAVVIESSALAIREGSLDFWVRFEGPAGTQGLLSRDANGQDEPGHLSIFRSCDDHIVVRMQDDLLSTYRCSNTPIASRSWTHVRLDFGAPDLVLFVDGAVQEARGESNLWGEGCADGPVSCRGTLGVGLDGNQNPLVIGASAYQAVPGTAEPLVLPFVGAIDSLHLRNVR